MSKYRSRLAECVGVGPIFLQPFYSVNSVCIAPRVRYWADWMYIGRNQLLSLCDLHAKCCHFRNMKRRQKTTSPKSWYLLFGGCKTNILKQGCPNYGSRAKCSLRTDFRWHAAYLEKHVYCGLPHGIQSTSCLCNCFFHLAMAALHCSQRDGAGPWERNNIGIYFGPQSLQFTSLLLLWRTKAHYTCAERTLCNRTATHDCMWHAAEK